MTIKSKEMAVDEKQIDSEQSNSRQPGGEYHFNLVYSFYS